MHVSLLAGFKPRFDCGAELRWRILEIMLTSAIVSFILVDPCCVSAVNCDHHPSADPSQHFVVKDE
jgi:hypothetical protein